MRVLIVCPYPHGQAPSQRFRFEQYLEGLETSGIQYDQKPFLNQSTWQVLYQEGHIWKKLGGILGGFLGRFVLLFRLRIYSFVLIHREASPIGPPIFEWWMAKIARKKIIFDFDDAIWLPNTSQSNRLVAWLKFHQKTAWICRWAYKVSAGNAYLADYARQFNSRVIINPTTIDTENWHCNLRDQTAANPLVVGWTGTHSTMKYLEELVPLLREMQKDIDFQFLLISNQAPDFQLPRIEFQAWQKDSEIADLMQMHVGIMPLSDDPWSKGKCGFKALQYMALGIPALASPVGVNKEIIDHGENGYLCQEPEDWKQALLALLQNANLRKEMGRKAREKIITHYSVRSNQKNFRDLFQI